MKKLIILLCLLLCSCGMINSNEQDMEKLDVIEDEKASGEPLEAIFYNGECYYGLPFGDTMREEEQPDDFEYIGTISSISDFLVSPTKELESSLGNLGDEVYHFVDEEGYHNFYSPLEDEARYRGIIKATTDKPRNYDQ